MKKKKQSKEEADFEKLYNAYSRNQISVGKVIMGWLGRIFAWGLILLALFAVYAGFVALSRFIWG